MKFRNTKWVLSATAAVLAACGGGGGSSSTPAPTDTSSHLSGTAAYGAPMSLANITIVDANGKSVSATADANGQYNADITGFTAPLLVTATVSSGDAVRTYHTLINTSVAAGSTGHANVTPLTEAIVALTSSDGISPEEFADTDKLKALDTGKLQKAVDAIRAAIQNVTAQLGNASFDPVSSSFVADRTSAGDKLLDAVKVTVDQDGVTLRNAWVPLPDTDSGVSGGAVLTLKDVNTQAATPLSAPAVTDAKFLDAWVAQVNQCLALAPAQRVSVDGNGSPTGFLGACAQVSGFAQTYKHNGYTLLQYWGNQLRNWIPGGAVMQPPEILGFLTNSSGDDSVIVRLSFTSPKGGGSYFETARKISGNWLIAGNQRNYDATVSVRALRLHDRSTNPFVPLSGPDAGKSVGWFDSYTARLHFGFNQSGPNGADVFAVRIKGPGLPASGIVLARSWACGTSNYLAFHSNNGSVPMAPAVGDPMPMVTSAVSNRYTLAVAPYGNRYTGSDFYDEWRGRNPDGTPTSYTGNATAPAPGVDVSSIPPLAKYTFEVFKAGSSDVADTFSVRIVTRPVAPAFAAKLPWANFDADTLNYLDPTNATFAGGLSAATLSWSVPAGAPSVTSAWIFGSGFDNGTPGIYRQTDVEGTVAALGDTGLALSAAQVRNGNGTPCSYAKLAPISTVLGYREAGTRQSRTDGLVLMQLEQHTGRSTSN